MFHCKSKIMFRYKFCFMFCYKFSFKQNVLLHPKWTWRVTWQWQSWRRGSFCWNSVHTCLRPCTLSSCFGYNWLNVMDDVFCCICQWGCPGWDVKLKQNQKCVTLILIIVYFHLHVDQDTQERNQLDLCTHRNVIYVWGVLHICTFIRFVFGRRIQFNILWNVLDMVCFINYLYLLTIFFLNWPIVIRFLRWNVPWSNTSPGPMPSFSDTYRSCYCIANCTTLC